MDPCALLLYGLNERYVLNRMLMYDLETVKFIYSHYDNAVIKNQSESIAAVGLSRGIYFLSQTPPKYDSPVNCYWMATPPPEKYVPDEEELKVFHEMKLKAMRRALALEEAKIQGTSNG